MQVLQSAEQMRIGSPDRQARRVDVQNSGLTPSDSELYGELLSEATGHIEASQTRVKVFDPIEISVGK